MHGQPHIRFTCELSRFHETCCSVMAFSSFFLGGGVRSLHPLIIKFSDVSEKRPAAILKVPGSVQVIRSNAEEANMSVQQTRVLSKDRDTRFFRNVGTCTNYAVYKPAGKNTIIIKIIPVDLESPSNSNALLV